jgi:hypothetical protein
MKKMFLGMEQDFWKFMGGWLISGLLVFGIFYLVG